MKWGLTKEKEFRPEVDGVGGLWQSLTYLND